MAIVASYDWESDTWTHNGDNPARVAWRSAVQEVAERAKAALPAEVNGRIEKAVAIVLNGDVELLEGGTARVASQSNGTTQYVVCNGTCECRDFAKAPQGFCKHRLSVAMYKRATALAKGKLDQLNGTTNNQAVPPSQPTPAPEPAPNWPRERTTEGVTLRPGPMPTTPAESPLPEAPASCNVYVTLAGRKVQVTLRDSDEQRLLARLEALLKRFPAEDEPEQEPAEGWCSTHGVQMKLRNGEHGSWWSYKTADGWCKGK